MEPVGGLAPRWVRRLRAWRAGVCAGLLAGALGCPGAAPAQVAAGAALTPAWPSRPLRLVVTFAPGGITDFTARMLAPKLAEALGQPVIVENRTGSGGNIGTDFVAKAPPDGHVLLLAGPPNAINVSLYKALPFDTRRDLAAVALVGSVPNVLVVGPRLPVRTLDALLAQARTHPGALNFASNGTGTTIQLSAELLKYYGRFDAVHVPYRGAPAATAALLGGDVDFMFDSLSVSYPNIRAGKVRVLAVTSAQRSPLLSDVPTMAELGFPQIEVNGWTGIMVTAGTPAPVIERLEAEIRKIVALPEVVSAFQKPGMAVTFLPAAAFAQFLEAEIQRWALAVSFSHAQAD
jgi:tripartite-type tricarboxylate transporter receptor subunit TctC